MTRKANVLHYLQSINPKAVPPTTIGLALRFSYGVASSSVKAALKSLIKDGSVVRLEKPVRYGIKAA